MIHSWFVAQLDFVFCCYGLAFVLLAVMCLGLARRGERSGLQWPWLGLFGLIHGVNEWLDMLALGMPNPSLTQLARTVVMAASFAALVEFGRRSLRHQGGIAIGPWLTPFLIALSGLGWLAGPVGFAVACRLSLALPGGLLAALALGRGAKAAPDGRGTGLRLAALAMLVYAPAAALIAPRVAAFPVAYLDQATFLAVLGVPVQVLRGLCAILTAVGIWLHSQSTAREQGSVEHLRRWFTAASLVLLVVAGWAATQWQGAAAEGDMRTALLRRAVAVAQTIDPEYAKSLSFTPADVANPVFQRLRAGLVDYGRATGQSRIFTRALRGRALVSGPQSTEERDGSVLTPGTTCEPPDAASWDLFRFARPQIVHLAGEDQGPPAALAPVCDARTGEVLLAAGAEASSELWRVRIARARLVAIAVTLVLAVFLLGGVGLLRWRRSRPALQKGWLTHAETGLVTAAGLVLTVTVALAAHQIENRVRNQDFGQLADGRAKAIRENFRVELRDIADMARFLGQCNPLSCESFEAFAEPQTRRSAVQAYEWIPRVMAADRQRFEAEKAREGFPGLRITEPGPRDDRVTAGVREDYFPVSYAAPLCGNGKAVGFDVQAEPLRRAALEEARRTRLETATPPVRLVQETEEDAGMLVFHPVFRDDRASAAGFATGVLRVRSALARALSSLGQDSSQVYSDLIDVTTPDRPVLLASHPDPIDETHAPPSELVKPLGFRFASTYPLFLAGRTWVVLCYAGAEYAGDHPAWVGMASGLAGLLLTLVLTVFVGFLRTRQVSLEREVHARTIELGKREEDLAVTLHSIGDAVIATDLDGRVTRMNPVAEELTGWSLDESEGRPLAEIFHIINARTREPMVDPVAAVLTSGQTAALANDTTLVTRDGNRLQIADSAAPIRDAAGRIRGAVLVFHDVTAEYWFKERLRLSEERYRFIADNVADAIWTYDLEWRTFPYASPSVEKLLGYSVAEVQQRTLRDLVTPEAYRAVAENLPARIAAFAAGDQEARIQIRQLDHVRKDGSVVSAEVMTTLLTNPDGQVSAILGVSRDITERKRAEGELRDYAQALESANKALEEFYQIAESATRAKSEFLANMSHEIRTPMTAILGYTDILARSLDNPQHLESLNTIRRNGRHLLSIINDILDLSKIEAGKFETERIACSPAELLADVLALMQVRADAKGLKVSVEYATPIPRTITTDPTRLRQILVNLAGNALKFTETGGVRIVVRVEDEDGPSPRLACDVIDTGIGMTSDQLEALFRPFSQADASTSRKFGGTGLGLAISQRFAELLEGKIVARSVPGEGSTFTVTVATGPLAGIERFDAPVAAALAAKAAAPAPSKVRLPCRVLFADDGAINRRLISHFLGEAGAEVTTVENGQEALEKAIGQGLPVTAAGRPRPFDVILMDMQMPVMDGLEATRRLREAGYAGPIIALTASAMVEDREKCLSAGCDAHLAKPCDREKLLATVASYLQNSDLRPAKATSDLTSHPIEKQVPMDIPRVRILLAEDTPDIRKLSEFLLTEAGADVTAVENGALAAEKALAENGLGRPFDLILMDMQMPVMDGFDATRRLRQEGYQGRIVALTAHSMTTDRERSLAAGCDDFITKPIEPDRLESLVKELAAAASNAPAPAPERRATADVLHSQYANRPAVARMLGEFIGRLSERVQAMQSALCQSQCEELRRLAHQLKGAAGSYGYPALSAAARLLEDEAREGRLEPCAAALERVAAVSQAVLNGWEAPSESPAT